MRKLIVAVAVVMAVVRSVYAWDMTCPVVGVTPVAPTNVSVLRQADNPYSDPINYHTSVSMDVGADIVCPANFEPTSTCHWCFRVVVQKDTNNSLTTPNWVTLDANTATPFPSTVYENEKGYIGGNWTEDLDYCGADNPRTIERRYHLYVRSFPDGGHFKIIVQYGTKDANGNCQVTHHSFYDFTTFGF
jgi:hypothetical protein